MKNGEHLTDVFPVNFTVDSVQNHEHLNVLVLANTRDWPLKF